MKPLKLRLKVLTPQAAKLAGYKPITIPISLFSELEIIRSLEQDLKGSKSVWITNESGTEYTAARHESEIKTVEVVS